MAKYGDTVLFHVSKYTDTTKRIKRLIYEYVLETGFAPKVEQIKQELNLTEEAVRKSLWDLEGGIIIAMQNKQHLHIKEFIGQKLPEDVVLPDLGEIFYARPFANFKNHHKIFVDGEQKWFGECPVESVTISYFFPGKEVVLQSICNETHETIEIIGKDGKLLDYKPKTLRIYWGRPFGQWLSTKGYEGDFIFPCDSNYFFHSEKIYYEWRKGNPDAAGQIFTPVEIHHLLRIFNYGHERFDFQYHVPLLKILLASVSTGIIRLKMFVPVPNMFFLSIIKLLRDVHKFKYKLFLDIKAW